jgi:hypothetical protein
MHVRRLGPLPLALLLAACPTSNGTDAGEGASSSESTQTTDASDSTDTGELPPNCGWNGSGYACGVMGEDPGGTPLPCAGEQMVGACSANDELQSCCDADGNAWACVCDGQACDYLWTMTDCAHAPGSGACGWWAEWSMYSCGGEGEDPNGTPIACAPEPVVGAECDPVQDVPCCDANGDEWECLTADNGGPSTWAVWDC